MEKARKKIKLCSTCHGEGGAWHQTEHPRHGSDQGKSEWVSCPICGGSGRVIIEKEIKIVAFTPNIKINH